MKNYNDKIFSKVEKFQTVRGGASLEDLHNNIKYNSKIKRQIAQLRQLLAEDEKEKASWIKKTLPAFTPNGTFHTIRRDNNLIKHSGVFCLDLDKVDEQTILTVREEAKQLPGLLMAFISPSGNGLKLLIKTDFNKKFIGSKMTLGPLKEIHKRCFLEVNNYYGEQLGVSFDENVKQLAALCFLSHDEEVYFNPNVEAYKLSHDNDDNPNGGLNFEPIEPDKPKYVQLDLFSQAVQFTNNIEKYESGNRNNYIHLLANNCNRLGLPIEETIESIKLKLGYEKQRELEATVKSAYNHHKDEHAKFKPIKRKSKVKQNEVSKFQKLLNTPTVSDEVYQKLPNFFQIVLSKFTGRKKDIFLSGLMSLVGQVLIDLRATYYGSTIYPCLYTIVYAPAASGKGVLDYLGDLSLNVAVDFERATYNAMKKIAEENNKEVNMLQVPTFLIPSDSSSASLIDKLNANDGRGFFLETEADVFSTNSKNDWGISNEMMRKGFHHEEISIMRKSEKTFKRVHNPRFSIVISGTPDQIIRFIKSEENGMFSRLNIHAFASNDGFENPFEAKENLNEFFRSKGEVLLDAKKFFKGREVAYKFRMDDNIKDDFFSYFSEKYADTLFNEGSEAVSSTIRLGIIAYRIMMILSAFRHYELNNESTDIYMSNVDYEIAKELTELYYHNAMLTFNFLRENKNVKLEDKDFVKNEVYKSLPDRFTKEECIESISQYGLGASESSFKRMIKFFKQKDLIQDRKVGSYYLKK